MMKRGPLLASRLKECLAKLPGRLNIVGLIFICFVDKLLLALCAKRRGTSLARLQLNIVESGRIDSFEGLAFDSYEQTHLKLCYRYPVETETLKHLLVEEPP
jgi:hypothetical protein